MGKYFGTDGIRGVVNSGLDAELAFRTGKAVAAVLAANTGKKPLITIGKDTRISSDMLESALAAGLCSAGSDVIMLGVIPTPAVAYVTVDFKADAGIVISASHNPYEHNGIKIFNGQGYKLFDEIEEKIEYYIDHEDEIELKTRGELGRVFHKEAEGLRIYIDHISSLGENEIKDLKVVIDCANGASSATAHDIFTRFPIDVDFINDKPNGVNINDHCGSTHTESLKEAVVSGGYDIGIAFDGDADRCLAVDEKGNLIDGDKIMGICGLSMMKAGKLNKNVIVATVMSNMGFHVFAREKGIDLKCAAVGDRYVLEMMQAEGYNLGGEQSGHLIFLDDSTTGDGQLSAVKFLKIVSQSDISVSEMIKAIPQYPQVLINVPISGGNEAKNRVMKSEELRKAVEEESKILGNSGRVLVRPSGTEALIRVMVEAKTKNEANESAMKLVNLVKSI